jgi:hypothetical protein
MTVLSSLPHHRSALEQNRVMTLRPQGRAVVVCALAGMLLAVAADPVAAHGGGSDAPYYRTQLASADAQPAGVTVRVDPAGEWIEVAYSGGGTIVILGYLDEPYLRLTATTVDENTLSESTYLNQAMFADMPTATSEPTVEPKWHRIATSGVARWHDHRIHWMGQTRPPVVAADPGHPHTVGTWTVHGLAGSTPFDIKGTIEWRGRPQGPPVIVWYLVGGSFAFLIAFSVIHGRARRPTIDTMDPTIPRAADLFGLAAEPSKLQREVTLTSGSGQEGQRQRWQR